MSVCIIVDNHSTGEEMALHSLQIKDKKILGIESSKGDSLFGPIP